MSVNMSTFMAGGCWHIPRLSSRPSQVTQLPWWRKLESGEQEGVTETIGYPREAVPGLGQPGFLGTDLT